MNAILVLVIGIVLGIVVGWLWVTVRSKAELAKAQIEAEGRVKAAESTLSEVRAQLNALQSSFDAKAKEISGLQQMLRGEGEQKVKAQTEVEQLRGMLEDLDALRARLKIEGELRVAAETKLEEAQASLEEQKKLLEDAKKDLVDTFQARKRSRATTKRLSLWPEAPSRPFKPMRKETLKRGSRPSTHW
jgi:chromosome segregation ATPase